MFDKSKPSSILDFESTSPPSRTFLKFLTDSFMLGFWTMFVDKFDKNGIVKANKKLKKIENPVKYKDLNFWKLILVNGFFFKIKPWDDYNFCNFENWLTSKFFFINLLNNIFFKLPPPFLPLIYNDITSFEHLV